jgi:sulfoxide reductase heme-binding subunit YedZ
VTGLPISAHAVTNLTVSHVLAAGTGPSPLWYTTRATGVVALLLLTGTVALGVAGTARLETQAMPRVVRSGLHRNLALLAVAFVAVHVLTAVLDPYAGIGFVAAVVPFSSAYRPLWLGLGAVALDLLAALVISSLVRSRLSYSAWRALHWLAYACWPVALWHGLGTGTDTRLSWVLLLNAACVLVVVVAACWRVRFAARAGLRTSGIAVTVLLLLATCVFVLIGPLKHGWARHAGTPSRLLGSTHGRTVLQRTTPRARPGDSE